MEGGDRPFDMLLIIANIVKIPIRGANIRLFNAALAINDVYLWRGKVLLSTK